MSNAKPAADYKQLTCSRGFYIAGTYGEFHDVIITLAVPEGL